MLQSCLISRSVLKMAKGFQIILVIFLVTLMLQMLLSEARQTKKQPQKPSQVRKIQTTKRATTWKRNAPPTNSFTMEKQKLKKNIQKKVNQKKNRATTTDYPELIPRFRQLD